MACPDEFKFEIVKQLHDYFTEMYDCITIDGVRILFDRDTWGIIRCSNTTPNITMRFEALSPEKLEEAIEIVAKQLKKYPEIDMSWYNTERTR